jgi:hypothetical protein
MEVRLRAEPAIFYQLTRNVSGDEPQDEGEVWEYAEEFFNVLCGRFISAICNRDHIRMRFDPPRYQKAADVSDMETDRLLHTLSFKTEKDELLEFLWGKAELCC